MATMMQWTLLRTKNFSTELFFFAFLLYLIVSMVCMQQFKTAIMYLLGAKLKTFVVSILSNKGQILIILIRTFLGNELITNERYY